MRRRRSVAKQVVVLMTVALALFAGVGWFASLTDTSTPQERACITHSGNEFYRCVWFARNAKRPIAPQVNLQW